MRTFPDVRIRSLMNKVRKATNLVEKGEHAEAQTVLADVRAQAAKAGIESAFVVWNIAVCQQALGDLEAAFETVCEAARLDPLAHPIQSAFDSIAWGLRVSIVDPEPPVNDISIARRYSLLMAAGECDVTSHVAMARHMSALGEHDRAMRILDAVTLLACVSQDAWRAKATVARAMGNESLAAECEAQATAIAESDVPFGMAATAASC